MLKATISSQVLTANEMLGARVLAINKIVDIGGGNGSKRVEPKTGRSESQKLAKSQILFKSKSEKSKKLWKSRNSPNFNATEARLSFLIFEARTAFNRLWLAFIKAPILWYFDPECHIWIKLMNQAMLLVVC